MVTITLKGREIPLIYTVLEMKAVQEEIAPLGKFQYVIFGRNENDEKDNSKYGSPEHLDAIAKLIRIMGNAGLEENGEAPDLTERKILRALKPSDIVDAVNACMDAMNEGMVSEIPTKNQDEPVDVTLEEIKKKKVRES